jgi:O-antigen/teichoic acid export membrane protein
VTRLWRLLHIGSVTESVGVYVTAKIAQKGIGLVRVLLLAWMLAEVPVQYGLVGMATVLMGVLTVIVSLGGGHGVMRYTSQIHARGELRDVGLRSIGYLACGAVGVGLVAVACSGLIATHFLASRQGAVEVPWRYLLWVTWACVANAVIESIYNYFLSLLNGLRVYRLIAALELTFATLFTLAASGTLLLWKTVLAVLLAHVVCVTVMLVAAGVAARALVHRIEPPSDPAEQAGKARLSARRPAGRFIAYGWPLALAGLVALAGQYASFYLAYRRFGQARAGVLWFFVQLSQPVLLIAHAAWAVVFTHVVARWEQGRREEATFLLRLAGKGLTLGLTTVAVAIYVASPVWTDWLPGRFQQGEVYLPGFLIFFQMLANLVLVTVLARVHERPILPPLLSGVALAVNVLLARWWMDSMGPVGASWAAGAAMLVVGAVLGGGYLLFSRARLGWSTGVLLLSPVVLLAPRWVAGLVWLAVLAMAACGVGLVSREERKALTGLWKRLITRGQPRE